MAECLITVGQMTNLCMCIIVVRQHPESLDYDLATLQAEKAADEAAVQDTEAHELKNSRAYALSINHGLNSFQMIPKDEHDRSKYSGDQLFNHVCRFWNINAVKKTNLGNTVVLKPSAALDIHLQPDSLECVMPSVS
jgi:hypothetical protein